jgi:hypothetical protein
MIATLETRIATIGNGLAPIFLVAFCAWAGCTSDQADYPESLFDSGAAFPDAPRSEVPDAGARPPCTLLAPCTNGDQLLPDLVCPSGFECYLWNNCGVSSLCACPAREGGPSDAAPCSHPDAEVL